MSWYLKLTSISGYDTTDPGPPPGLERFNWGREHRVAESRRGHMKPEACRALAKRKGIVSTIEVTWSTSDLNGKGTGGLDRRFTISPEGEVTEIEITAEENLAWAQMDANDAHETA